MLLILIGCTNSENRPVTIYEKVDPYAKHVDVIAYKEYFNKEKEFIFNKDEVERNSEKGRKNFESIGEIVYILRVTGRKVRREPLYKYDNEGYSNKGWHYSPANRINKITGTEFDINGLDKEGNPKRVIAADESFDKKKSKSQPSKQETRKYYHNQSSNFVMIGNGHLTFNELSSKPNNKKALFERDEYLYQELVSSSNSIGISKLLKNIYSIKKRKYEDLGIEKKEYEKVNEYTEYQNYLSYQFRQEEAFQNNYSLEREECSYWYDADKEILYINLPKDYAYKIVENETNEKVEEYNEVGYKIGEDLVLKKSLKDVKERVEHKLNLTKDNITLLLKMTPDIYKKYFFKNEEKVKIKQLYSLRYNPDIEEKIVSYNDDIKNTEVVSYGKLKYTEVYYGENLIGSF